MQPVEYIGQCQRHLERLSDQQGRGRQKLRASIFSLKHNSAGSYLDELIIRLKKYRMWALLKHKKGFFVFWCGSVFRFFWLRLSPLMGECSRRGWLGWGRLWPLGRLCCCSFLNYCFFDGLLDEVSRSRIDEKEKELYGIGVVVHTM